jgi:hypothetical protein
MHWLAGGLAFLGLALPVFARARRHGDHVKQFMLLTALLYTLAAWHLERPLIWSGCDVRRLLMIVVANPPHAWTYAGVATAVSLAWAGIAAQRANRNANVGLD